jgi:hypothetical protein
MASGRIVPSQSIANKMIAHKMITHVSLIRVHEIYAQNLAVL